MPEMTRRNAVKLGAAAAAAPFAAATAAGAPVNYALMGTGGRGRALLSHLQSIAGARCAVLCDSDERSLSITLNGTPGKPATCKDYRAVLDRKDIGAVLIATPLHTHFAIARDALLAGKHVFIENVLVFRPQEVHALRALAGSRTEQVIQVGLQRRYSKFYQVARQMVSKGLLGEVTHIQAQWHCNPGWTLDPTQPREKNWRLYRAFSGGLTSELASHLIDVADWMFGDTFEFVSGVGGLDWKRDGRDTYDNIALTFKYPFGQKLICTAITTNKHLALFDGRRSGCGELILGTDGSIEITIGEGDQPALGLWFIEPGPRVDRADQRQQLAALAGATAARGERLRGFPILFERDQMSGEESFLQRELKFARRWLYAKGILVPEEDRHPVRAELEEFFESCRTGKTPKADLEAGLNNSAVVILANLAMDEGRRVQFREIEKMGGAAGAAKPS